MPTFVEFMEFLSNCMSQEPSDPASVEEQLEFHPDAEWRELLRRARAGELEALGEVWQPFFGHLLHLAGRQLGRDLLPRLSASDIVQESLLEAQTGFVKFNGQSQSEMRAWLEQILKHNVLDIVRKYRDAQRRSVRREESLRAGDAYRDLPSLGPTASSLAQHVEQDEQLGGAIASLPDRRRAIIEMRHRDGMSYAEIAQSMNISETAARKLWSRAIEQLRQSLAQRDVDESQ